MVSGKAIFVGYPSQLNDYFPDSHILVVLPLWHTYNDVDGINNVKSIYLEVDAELPTNLAVIIVVCVTCLISGVDSTQEIVECQ